MHILCTTILERETKDLDAENDRKSVVNKKSKKQPVTKSARELLSALLKLLREEKKELDESEEVVRTLSSCGSKTQPELKKQRGL